MGLDAEEAVGPGHLVRTGIRRVYMGLESEGTGERGSGRRQSY